MAYLESPEDDGGEKVVLGHHTIQMYPQEGKRKHNEHDVEVKEGLVECMANGGGRVHKEGSEGAGSLTVKLAKFKRDFP